MKLKFLDWILIVAFVLGSGLVFFDHWRNSALENKNTKAPTMELVSANSEDGGGGKTMVVDVSGAVLKPGVYSLKDGGRVIDALELAGGMSAEADREYTDRYINLADKVKDGQKVYIPKKLEMSKNISGSYQSSVDPKVNINSASKSELETLTGVGEVTAQKIIDSRPYSSVQEAVDRKVISKSVYEKNIDKLSVY